MSNTYSAIIPLYNKERHVIRALESAVAALKGFEHEVIVVDDGSTDYGADKVEQFATRHPGVKIDLVLQENRGVSVARNVGVNKAQYDYVLFLDADDEWRQGFVNTVDRMIRTYPNAGLFATACADVWNTGISVNPLYRRVPKKSSGGVLERYFLARARGAEPVCSSSVCIKKSVYNNIGGFPEGVSHGEDKIFWARIALRVQMVWTPVVEAIRYRYADNQSDDKISPAKARQYLDELDNILKASSYDEQLVSDIEEDIAMELAFYSTVLINSGERCKALQIIVSFANSIPVRKRTLLLAKLAFPRFVIDRLIVVRAYFRHIFIVKAS